jgi:hypothetical protein
MKRKEKKKKEKKGYSSRPGGGPAKSLRRALPNSPIGVPPTTELAPMAELSATTELSRTGDG